MTDMERAWQQATRDVDAEANAPAHIQSARQAVLLRWGRPVNDPYIHFTDKEWRGIRRVQRRLWWRRLWNRFKGWVR